ncbi:MAG: hypothetical protein V1757_01075 [Actinomycetota bacterium]
MLRRLASDGTLYIVAGTITAAIGAYLFQMVGGRALGTVDFDPVTALLTVHLLIFSVLLLPVEQFEIRRVTLDRTGGAGAIGAVIVFGAVGAVVFTLLTRNHFFAGETGYAVIAGVAVAFNALLAVARGRLAGHRRFRAYGLVSGIVAMARVGMALAFLAVVRSGLSVGWALAVAPVLTLAWHPFRREGPVSVPREEEPGGRFLGGFVVASAASQVLLLAAPIAVRILDDTPGLMSIVFVTFQLFRAPIVVTQNLLARLLPPFTRLAAEGRRAELRAWAVRFGLAAAAVAPVAAVVGALLGPWAVRLLFGAAFQPGMATAGYAAAGIVIATTSLLAGQVLVAQGNTVRLAAAWGIGFAVAIVAMVPAIGAADVRVARAFVAGEVAALLAIVFSGGGSARATR